MTGPNGAEAAAGFNDLRTWLRHLAATDRLALANKGTDLSFGLAAIAKRLEGERAVLFPEPGGHSMPVVANLLAGRRWAAECLGVTEDQALARYQDAVRQPLATVEVADAPVQAVVHQDVDLLKLLPIPTHNELDSGPYIAAGLMIARNPETGVQNVSIHRCQISAANRIGVLLLPRHTHAYVALAERRGQALEVAIVIGVDPASLLASQAIVPLDFDEMTIAGALHGAPVEVVKCLTNAVRVPARAEIVIEGRILAQVREPEGPFGEFPQYYGPRADRHVIEVDTVTHRSRPIFHTIVGGGLEHLVLGAIPREATLLDGLQRHFPNVVDVHLTRGGVCRYHLVVKIDGHEPGQPKNIMMGAFAGHFDVKQVVVVDSDVDIHDPEQVEWAIATRFQADTDVLVVSGAQGSKLDPSARSGLNAKMGLDATIPTDADDFAYKKIYVPGEEAVDPATAVVAADAAMVATLLGS